MPWNYGIMKLRLFTLVHIWVIISAPTRVSLVWLETRVFSSLHLLIRIPKPHRSRGFLIIQFNSVAIYSSSPLPEYKRNAK